VKKLTKHVAAVTAKTTAVRSACADLASRRSNALKDADALREALNYFDEAVRFLIIFCYYYFAIVIRMCM
jgi:hypothetical protein